MSNSSFLFVSFDVLLNTFDSLSLLHIIYRIMHKSSVNNDITEVKTIFYFTKFYIYAIFLFYNKILLARGNLIFVVCFEQIQINPNHFQECIVSCFYDSQ